MHTIQGKWFESGSAASTAATLNISGDEYTVLSDNKALAHGSLSQISVSDRLGKLERKLTLADDSVFATHDNDAVDQAFATATKANGFLFKLESNFKWVAVALALTIVTTVGFFKWGLPWLSHTVAHALPHQTGELIGSNTLEFLDDYIFEPSRIKEERQTEISTHFYNNLVPQHQINQEITYTLHFRAWGEGDNAIPNALALPSGDIIVTDRFVELATVQDEIDAVLLHEMGHVEHRHTLEMVTQSTLVAVVLAVLTGDASGAGDMGIGLGSLLVTTGYSRSFETEADKFAFEHMLKAGINPESFATIMAKITELETPEDKANDQPQVDNAQEEDSWIDYLSTHPNTKERIAQAKRYARCFHQGKLVCDGALILGGSEEEKASE